MLLEVFTSPAPFCLSIRSMDHMFFAQLDAVPTFFFIDLLFPIMMFCPVSLSYLTCPDSAVPTEKLACATSPLPVDRWSAGSVPFYPDLFRLIRPLGLYPFLSAPLAIFYHSCTLVSNRKNMYGLFFLSPRALPEYIVFFFSLLAFLPLAVPSSFPSPTCH